MDTKSFDVKQVIDALGWLTGVLSVYWIFAAIPLLALALVARRRWPRWRTAAGSAA